MGAGPVRQQLEYLLNGFSFYSARDRLRADDLLVRQRAASALGAAAAALRDLAAEYRRGRVPDPSREHPLPPADAMAGLRAIEAVHGDAELAETAVRSQPFPAEDRTWARLRSEHGALELALSFDRTLIAAADRVQGEAAGLGVDAWDAAPANPAAPLGQVRRALAELRSVLADRARHMAPDAVL